MPKEFLKRSSSEYKKISEGGEFLWVSIGLRKTEWGKEYEKRFRDSIAKYLQRDLEERFPKYEVKTNGSEDTLLLRGPRSREEAERIILVLGYERLLRLES